MATRDKKAFLLRMDPELWADLERLAAAELRSVNAQVEFLLRRALQTAGRLKSAPETPTGHREPGGPHA
jgi:hypothetical protein